MGKLFGSWFSADGFTLWKLQSREDYLNFALVVFLGVAAFALAQSRIDRHRNYKSACDRVARRLRKLGGPGAVCYQDVTVHWRRTMQPCPFLYVDGGCVYAVKVFWWGLDVSGTARDKEWIFTAGRDVRREPNPLPGLRETCVVLSRLLVCRGLKGVEVKPLVVLADNFGSVRSRIPDADCVVPYQDLKKWRGQNPVQPENGFDIQAVRAALESAFREEASAAP